MNAETGNPYLREIKTRITNPDGSEEVALECGHVVIRLVPIPRESIYCAECLEADIEKAKGTSKQ